ncbi:Flavin reductase domain protein FMN-binding [Parafrankia sp. Ea1.12]|uniref:flavin reductase family protein n=1 Tax=Parafrankia sp. Ea1.12 TaxID=573499 RepID=UPI000DA48AE6|nr:Flavin reductase domain protein FMN-binding [Parafrankia sp. Ea1.12]
MPKQVSAQHPTPRRSPARSVADPGALARAFRRHAAGVTIVTMAGPRGPVGFTATSVASLSERPPLVSLALSVRSSIAPVLEASETLMVHMLSEGQHELAARFAQPGADRFGPPTRWRALPGGEPLLLDAAVWLLCRIRRRTVEGDHHLVVAEVLDSQTGRAEAPLVYHDGAYGTVQTTSAGATSAGTAAAGTAAAGTAAAGTVPTSTAPASSTRVCARPVPSAVLSAGGAGPRPGAGEPDGTIGDGDLSIRGAC